MGWRTLSGRWSRTVAAPLGWKGTASRRWIGVRGGTPAERVDVLHAQAHQVDGDEDVLGDHDGDDGWDGAERARPGGGQHSNQRHGDLRQTQAQAAELVAVVQVEARRGRWPDDQGHGASPE